MPMMIRVYRLNVRSGPAAIALAAVALSLGAVSVAFGLLLLLGLAALGTMIGAGVLVFRALTGGGPASLRPSQPEMNLDPSLEVFPAQQPPQNPARIEGAGSQDSQPE
jgi:hypothetical protein